MWENPSKYRILVVLATFLSFIKNIYWIMCEVRWFFEINICERFLRDRMEYQMLSFNSSKTKP